MGLYKAPRFCMEGYNNVFNVHPMYQAWAGSPACQACDCRTTDQLFPGSRDCNTRAICTLSLNRKCAPLGVCPLKWLSFSLCLCLLLGLHLTLHLSNPYLSVSVSPSLCISVTLSLFQNHFLGLFLPLLPFLSLSL